MVLLAINALALLVLAGRQAGMRREIAQLRERSERLAGAAPLPPGLEKMAGENNSAILISILNPMELAAQKHWVAGTMSRLTPGLVRKIVYQEAVKIVSQELPKYGVMAEVKVVNGA